MIIVIFLKLKKNQYNLCVCILDYNILNCLKTFFSAYVERLVGRSFRGSLYTH